MEQFGIRIVQSFEVIEMKKTAAFIIAIMIMFTFSGTLQASACWAQPEPFEVFSDDGSKVFVFDPSDDGMSTARAGVYEIINNDTQNDSQTAGCSRRASPVPNNLDYDVSVV